MRIVVVEPHADDAFLSAHLHLVSWREDGHDVAIVTCFADERRAREGRSYAARLGVDHAWTGIPEGVRLDEAVATRIGDTIGSPDRLVAPLGIRHPEHRFVADLYPDADHYLDLPYALKPINGDDLSQRVAGRVVVSALVAGKAKWTGFDRMFPSQSLFWRNEGPLLTNSRTLEIIVR